MNTPVSEDSTPPLALRDLEEPSRTEDAVESLPTETVETGPSWCWALFLAVVGVLVVGVASGVVLAILGEPVGVVGTLWVTGLVLPVGGTGVAVLVVGWRHWSGLLERLALLPLARQDARAPLVAVGVAVFSYLVATPLVWLSIQILAPFGYEPKPNALFETLANHPTVGVWASIFAIAVVVAPLSEEILFRLVTVEAFRSLRLPGPVLLAAIVFALMHGQVEQMPGLCVFALLLYRLRERYASLRPAILAHAVFNTLALLGAIWQLTQT